MISYWTLSLVQAPKKIMHAKTFLDYFLLFIPYTVLDVIIVEKFLTIFDNF